MEKQLPEGVDPRFVNQEYKFQALFKDYTDNDSVHPLNKDATNKAGENVCAGVFYWEPEVDGKWKPAIYSKSGLVCSGWSAYDMGAFSSSGTTFSPVKSILSGFAE